MFMSNSLENSASLLDLLANTSSINKVNVINLQSKTIPFFIKKYIEEQEDENTWRKNLHELLEVVIKFNEIAFRFDDNCSSINPVEKNFLIAYSNHHVDFMN